MRLGLRPLRPGSRQPLYLLQEGVFAAAGSGRGAPPLLAASVPAYVQTLTRISPVEVALHADVLGRAGSVVRHLHELCFCLGELVPYLRERKGLRPLKVDGMAELMQRGGRIESDLEKLLRSEPYAEGLAESLGAPCAILGRAVIPLERAIRKRRSDLHVEIDGKNYRYALEHTQPLPEFLRRADRALREHVREAVLADDPLKVTVKEFRTALRVMLRRYKSSRQDGFSIFHRDDEYQLQHSAGVWLLLRGPLPVRVGGGTLFVTLRIRGRTRRERLSVAPATSREGRGLWRSPGVPARTGLCMGLDQQYRLLLSERFTEPEAVVQWLDAGAILATARPEFHQRWRHDSRNR